MVHGSLLFFISLNKVEDYKKTRFRIVCCGRIRGCRHDLVTQPRTSNKGHFWAGVKNYHNTLAISFITFLIIFEFRKSVNIK